VRVDMESYYETVVKQVSRPKFSRPRIRLLRSCVAAMGV